MDEPEAIARAKRHDISGLEGLVRMHQQAALRLAALITRDPAAAEDVVSEAFVRAYERIDQFDASRPFRPWFYRIVTNAALKTLRQRRRLDSLERWPDDNAALYELLGRLDAAETDPALAAGQAETSAAIRAALAQLSAEQRAVLVLRYWAEMSEADMATALGIPPGTVKSRLAAGARRLRGLLADMRLR